jgi:hypothetical protein
MIALYAGDNDLVAGRTPEQVLGDYMSFVRLVRRALPATRIIFLSIKPSPSRWALAEPMRAANALIAAGAPGVRPDFGYIGVLSREIPHAA